MSVADHLGIGLTEYDQKIRTFVPHYETLLRMTAEVLTVLPPARPCIVDLGIGTGALTAACLAVRPDAHVIGIDADPRILDAARYRLHDSNVELRGGSFLDMSLPPADAMVACIALHHIGVAEQKQVFYRRVFEALRPGGVFVSADCFPAVEPKLAALQRDAWLRHLSLSYSRKEAENYLHAWSGEDTYFPLTWELEWLDSAGFTAEVVWRADGFCVVQGTRVA